MLKTHTQIQIKKLKFELDHNFQISNFSILSRLNKNITTIPTQFNLYSISNYDVSECIIRILT